MDDPTAGIADALNHLGRDPSPDNWRRVVEGAWPLVAGPCFRICDQRGDDAVQEALLHVRAGARRFRPRGSDPDGDARRWLRRVATTSALAVLRTDRRNRTRSAHAAPPTAPPAPDQASSLADDLAVMHEELASLREPDRTAVALHHLQGQDVDEVARTLGCTPEAARKRIARALETLRARLGGRGVVLGLAALVTALREAPAVTVPAAPSQAALLLVHSPLVPTTSITLASGVAVMATTAGCASAVLATVLAWSYAAGADQTPAPQPAPPPIVVPAPPAAVHWLDLPMPDRAVRQTDLGVAARISLATGHPIFCRIGRTGPAEDIALAGVTPRTALDLFCKQLGTGWLLIEEQVAVLSQADLTRLLKELDPLPEDLSKPDSNNKLTTLDRYLQPIGWRLLVNPGALEKGRPINGSTWTTPQPSIQVLSLLALANKWTWTLSDDILVLSQAPEPRPLLEPAQEHLVIRGHPWTPSRLDQRVDFDVHDAPAEQVMRDLSRQTGIPIDFPTGDGAITLRVKDMRLIDALKMIGSICNANLTEPDIGKRLAFVLR